MFPRLTEKFDAKAILENQMVKKYVEINLEDEKADPETRARTDIEHEIIHKYKLNANRKEKEHQRKLERCLTRTFDCEPKSQRPSPEKVNSNINRYSSCHKNAISQNFNNLALNTDEESIIETENSDHSQYLAKIKSELSKKK